MCTIPLLSRVCRESYNDPEALYERLKQRGMDLVTVTDHDSVGSAGCLGRYPDFFLSEEVSCTTPSGTAIHVGVYDVSEKQHQEIQHRREDLTALVAYLEEHDLFFTINHIFSSLTGRRTEQDFEFFARHFPGVETRNGQMLAHANRLASDFARKHRKAEIAGSDAHSMQFPGRTYTEVPGARNKQEFMEGLRAGHGIVRGEAGGCWKLTRTVWSIGAGFAGERPWALVLAPLFLAVPAVAGLNYLREAVFARRWSAAAGGESRGIDVQPAAALSKL